MKKSFVLGFFLCLIASVAAQDKTHNIIDEVTSSKDGEGKVVVIQDPAINDLLKIHVDQNNRSKGVEGFRIQLYLGSNNNAKKEATEVKGKLLELFPDEKPYIMYEAPFWRVQVGDFRSKAEALGLYRKLKKEFPSCYPVPVSHIPLENLQ